MIWPQALAPETHQQVRSLNVYLNTALGFIFLFEVNGVYKLKNELFNKSLLIAAILGITQSLWNIQATMQWNQYRSLLRSELASAPAGVLLFANSGMQNLSREHGLSNGIHNDWATGYLSIYTYPGNEKKTLMAHTYDNVFRPLDVRDSTELPVLKKYNISFREFKSGLNDQLNRGELIIPDRDLPKALKWFETDSVGVNNFFE